MHTNTMKRCWNGSTGTTAVQSINQLESSPVNSACSDEAVQSCLEGLDTGDAAAMCELARCCMSNSISDDLVHQIAGNLVFKTKLNELARNYALGFVEPDSDSEAFQIFKLVENQNDPDVLCALGRAYQFGWGTAKDVAKAISCYVKAAEAGSWRAMKQLKDQSDSNNSDGELKTAFERFQQLAREGSAVAQFALGYCYYWGIGVSPNNKAAAQACQTAVSSECSQRANAMVLLGQLHRNGKGVQYSELQSFELFKLAAEAGNAEGQRQLAWCYKIGVHVAADEKQSAYWLEKALAQGHVEVAYDCAYAWENGHGVEKDINKAFQYYTLAALAGNGAAQSRLGSCYYYGHIVQKCCRKALFWFQKAASQGEKSSQAFAANILLKIRQIGDLAPKPVYAADLGEKGVSRVEKIENCRSGQETAFMLAKLACVRECAAAFKLLGDMYYFGLGTQQDFDSAAHCYEKCGDAYSAVLFRLAHCHAADKLQESELSELNALRRAGFALRSEIDGFLALLL